MQDSSAPSDRNSEFDGRSAHMHERSGPARTNASELDSIELILRRDMEEHGITRDEDSRKRLGDDSAAQIRSSDSSDVSSFLKIDVMASVSVEKCSSIKMLFVVC